MLTTYSELQGVFEIMADGRTVWVNDDSGGLVGRFSRNGIDVHHTVESQMQHGKQCLDCKAGPCTIADWAHFRDGMKKHYGVELKDAYMPRNLKAA